MKGGDISNEVPLRVLVTLDCIVSRTPKVKRVLGIPVFGQDVTYDRQSLSLFWRFAEKQGYVLELGGFEYDDKDMKRVMDDLDNLGTNPFNYSKAYNVVADLVAELPYRPEVKGVIDIPSRGLRYGHWFIDMGAFSGGR
jgi:hypothetical protein